MIILLQFLLVTLPSPKIVQTPWLSYPALLRTRSSRAHRLTSPVEFLYAYKNCFARSSLAVACELYLPGVSKVATADILYCHLNYYSALQPLFSFIFHNASVYTICHPLSLFCCRVPEEMAEGQSLSGHRCRNPCRLFVGNISSTVSKHVQ